MIVGTWLTATININANVSAEVDLERVWEKMMLVIPAITLSDVSLQVAEKSGGTFQALGDDLKISSVSNAFSTGITLGGFQFIKIVTSNVQAAAREFRVCGIRS